MREESFLEPTENGLVRTWVSWLFLLLSPLIFFISLVSNILTIVVILRTKFLHTKTNFYLCSLAISDLLLLLFSLPHHFVVELHPRWWPTEQDWVCKGRNLVKESATNASILTIMAFTFERYMAICKPFRPCGSLNPRKVVGHILLIWSLSIGFASILAYQMKMGPADSGLYVDKLNLKTLYLANYRSEAKIQRLSVVDSENKTVLNETNFFEQCKVDRNLKMEHFFVISSIIFFVVPMVLLAIVYSRIVRTLRKSLSGNKNEQDENNHFLTDYQRSMYQHTRARTLVIRMLIVVVTCFFFSFLPYHFQRLMATLTDEMKLKPFKKIWTMVAVTLYNLHTCHNFLIYHLFSKKFRVACWNLCCHHFMLTNRRRKTPKQRQGNLYQPIRFISSSKKNDAKLCTKGITPDPGYIPIIRIAEDKTLREFGIIHKISGNSRRPLLPQPSSSELLDYKPRGVYRHMPDCEEQIPLKPLFLAVPDPYEVCKNGGSDCIHQRCTSKTDENQNENFRVIPVSV